MLKSLISVLAAGSVAMGAASAATIVLDFEVGSERQVTAADFAGVSAINVTGPNAGGAFSFNTEELGGPDGDLEQPIAPAVSGDILFETGGAGFIAQGDGELAADAFSGLGFVGIIQNNNPGVGGPANDDPQGGLVEIIFDAPVIFEAIDFVDLNDAANGVVATLNLLGGGTVGFSIGGFDSVDNDPLDFASRVLATVDYTITSIQLQFNGSGAFDNLTVTEVNEIPIPGAIWLMIAGLAGLRASTRARKA